MLQFRNFKSLEAERVAEDIEEYQFMHARSSDLNEIYRIIESARKRPFCPWDEYYPTLEDIEIDILNCNGYCMKDGRGTIVSYIAHDPDPEENSLDVWNKELNPGAPIARMVVAEGYENRGIARMTINAMLDELRERGFKSARYLVAEDNTPAMRSYRKLEFEKKGEVDMFGSHFLCYEKEL